MNQRALSKHSESTQMALREYFVIPSEPKILRLVLLGGLLGQGLGLGLGPGLDNI